MKLKYTFLFFVLFTATALSTYFEAKQWLYPIVKKKQVIYLTAMGNITSEKVSLARKEIEQFYGIDVFYIGQNRLPASAYCKVRNRYVALEILQQLSKLQIKRNTKYNYKILALTDKDIEIENSQHWGIMGLAFLGGNACVDSTFRLNGSNDRFKKVTLHETGHMLGIDHCKFYQSDCLMNDAKGKGATVDNAKIFIYSGCRKKIII
jgi:archaemetzincin